jgi:hypothetical protein
MAKLTEAQKRKNFERTVGSSENDMGPLPKKDKKEYKDYDLSSPEKRGYAVRKAIIDKADSKYQRDGSNDLGNDMFNTGPERNIGPRMDHETYSSKKQALPGLDETESKARSGKWQAGYDKAKAETENVGPKMKKGGSVSSASKRADGIAVKGKTRGKIC